MRRKAFLLWLFFWISAAPSLSLAQGKVGEILNAQPQAAPPPPSSETASQDSLPFARALEATFSSGTWAALEVSTASAPAQFLTQLIRRGYYRAELIQIILMAQNSRLSLKTLLALREEGKSLTEIASLLSLDYGAVYDKALWLQDYLVKDVVPSLAVVVSSAAVAGPLPTPPAPEQAPQPAAPPPPAAELYDVELATAAIMLPGGETLVAEIAATGAEQAKGLMFRKRLGPRQGMLFPFRDARVWQFWMKDTWLDLDIVYIGDDKKISRIFSGVPRSYADTPEEKVAKVSARGRYVLELSSGTAARMGLKTGDALEFDLLGQTSR